MVNAVTLKVGGIMGFKVPRTSPLRLERRYYKSIVGPRNPGAEGSEYVQVTIPGSGRFLIVTIEQRQQPWWGGERINPRIYLRCKGVF